MTSYIIAGSADNDFTTKCEFLSVQVKENFPNIDFRVIIKDPREWDNYIKDICRCYGFKNKENPIIFKSNGTLIGNIRDFENYCENNFGVNNLQNTRLKSDTQTNKKKASREFNLKQKLINNKKSLSEKIIYKIETSLRSGFIKITNHFYNEIFNNGVTFYIKQEKNMQPCIKIPLKVSNFRSADQEQNEDFDPEEAAKQDFYQEVAGEQNDRSPMKREMTELKENIEENKNENENAEPNEQINNDHAELKEELEEESNRKEEIVQETVICEEKVARESTKPTEFPFGDYIIEQIKDGYYLALNPEPLINGQCMIFQDKRDIGLGGKLEVSKNNGSQSSVIFNDYSKCMKNRKNDKVNLMAEKDQTALNDKTFNIYEPLSIIDWSKTLKVIRKTHSYAFVQFLPFNSKNFVNFMNDVIHIIPRRFLISAKENKEIFSQENDLYQLPFEKYWVGSKREIAYTNQNKEQMLFYRMNLPFKHLFGKINEKSIGKNIHSLYYDMICFFKDIELIDVENSGMSIVMSDEYLFLAPLQKPILKYNGTHDIFLPPFTYLGYIHKPFLKFVWPDTVHERTIFDDTDKILEILKQLGEK